MHTLGIWRLAAAFVFGFLFGIPKVLQTVPKTTADLDPKNSFSGGSSPTPLPSKVNTNLEEISDWLTKILVGATLTQLIRVPGLVRAEGSYMANGMGGSAYETVAAATLLYFASVGFLAGYLLTRMFFSLAFARVEHGPVFPDVNVNNLRGTSIALGSTAEPAKDIRETARKLESVTISDSLTTPQIIAVAKAANITGDDDRAIQFARLAIEKSPSNPEAHLNLAVALHNAGGSQAEVVHELKLARRLIDRNWDTQTAEDIYISILYLYLYLDPPEGFQSAIRDGEDFVEKRVPTNGAIWINLACAYGQFYKYYKNHQQPPGAPPLPTGELERAKSRALGCIQEALKIEPQSVTRLRQLYNGTGRDPSDDDLRIFKGDIEFDKLLEPRD